VVDEPPADFSRGFKPPDGSRNAFESKRDGKAQIGVMKRRRDEPEARDGRGDRGRHAVLLAGREGIGYTSNYDGKT
jgi:hypothetical protein